MCLPHSQAKKPKENISHICEGFPEVIADLLWTVSLKHPRLWPVIKTLSCSGVRKHLLDSQRLWEGGGGFGSFVKRRENMHENLFTQNCRKASRLRIKVQVPSVWRADVYLADNYNPFKANKSTIMLFQHEGSQAWADTGSGFLIGCQLIRGRRKPQRPQLYQA